MAVANITEEDGSPSVYPWKMKFANAALTDNGDGTVSIAAGGGGGGNVSNSGTPVNDQLAIWVDATTIEGNTNITASADGSQIQLPDGSVVAGNSPGISFQSATDSGLAADASNLAIWESGSIALNLAAGVSPAEVRAPSDWIIGWSSATNNNALSDTQLSRSAAGIIQLGNGASYHSLILGTTAAATIPLTVKGTTSQSANLTEWHDNLAAVLAAMSSDGSLVLGASSPVSSSRLSVDGDADQIQFLVQAHSTQTSNIMVVEKSDGSDLFRVDNDRVYIVNQSDNVSNEILRIQGNNRATAADGDEAYITMQLEDSGGSMAEFSRITFEANDVTNTTKDGEIRFAVQVNNALTDRMVINESGVGIGTESPQEILHTIGDIKVESGTLFGGGFFLGFNHTSITATDNKDNFGGITYGSSASGTEARGLSFLGLSDRAANAAFTIFGRVLSDGASDSAVVEINSRNAPAAGSDWDSGGGSALVNRQVFAVKNATTKVMVVNPNGELGVNESSPTAQLHVQTSGTGVIGQIIKATASQTANLTEWQNSSGTVMSSVDDDGSFRIGSSGTPSAELHVDQSSATGAQPVLYLDQADVSEEMIEFNTTIGTGNAIEAVGAKTLTTTHFIKVTLPGGLTRYIPCGTIA